MTKSAKGKALLLSCVDPPLLLALNGVILSGARCKTGTRESRQFASNAAKSGLRCKFPAFDPFTYRGGSEE
jgi:hypothetical protein